MARRARLGGRAAAASSTSGRVRLREVSVASAVRALTAHEHATAAALFALVVLVYLWPALIGGQILLPATVLYQVVPWADVVPADIVHHFNPALSDVPMSYYPWDVLARRLIHAGTFPAWNPYAFAGTPFFANPEPAWLSPFSLPLWLLPLTYALGFVAALKLWVAAVGTYLLVRELRLGFWPGVVAGIGFALCAFDVVWLSHGVQVSVAALLPWTIWLVERVVRRGAAGSALALAGVVVLVLTGGHPGTQLHVLSAAGLYAVVRAVACAGADTRARLRRLGLVAAALGVGALVAAVVLLPAVHTAVDTVGAAARRDGSAGLPGATMPLEALRAALFPDWWGRPSELRTGGPGNYNERAFYAGAATLVLAFVGLLVRDGWRRKAPFALLGALGVAMALGAPGIHDLVVSLPLFDRVQNQRMMLWLLLAVAVLAAFGLQSVLDAGGRLRRAWGVVGVAALAGLAAGASVEGASGALGRAAGFFVHRTADTVPDAVPPLASVGWWLAFVAGVAGVLLLLGRRPARTGLAGGLAALLVALDMLHFAHGYQPIGPASTMVPPPTPAVAYLRRHADEGRIVGLRGAIANDWSTVYGLRDVRGYDAPQPSVRFARLWRAINPAQADWAPFGVDELSPRTLRVLGLLGARHIVTDPGVQLGVGGIARWLSHGYRGDDATVLRNAFAVPRAFVAARVRVAGDDREELAAVLRPGFDPRAEAVVRRDELGATRPLGATGSVRVTEEENARVVLRARLARPGVVVLDDAWAPGWSVRVDGRPARALQADVVMRGVVVPAGSHEIVWSYAVPGLRLGAALSAAGLLALLGWGGVLVRDARARRRTRSPARAA